MRINLIKTSGINDAYSESVQIVATYDDANFVSFTNSRTMLVLCIDIEKYALNDWNGVYLPEYNLYYFRQSYEHLTQHKIEATFIINAKLSYKDNINKLVCTKKPMTDIDILNIPDIDTTGELNVVNEQTIQDNQNIVVTFVPKDGSKTTKVENGVDYPFGMIFRTTTNSQTYVSTAFTIKLKFGQTVPGHCYAYGNVNKNYARPNFFTMYTDCYADSGDRYLGSWKVEIEITLDANHNIIFGDIFVNENQKATVVSDVQQIQWNTSPSTGAIIQDVLNYLETQSMVATAILPCPLDASCFDLSQEGIVTNIKSSTIETSIQLSNYKCDVLLAVYDNVHRLKKSWIGSNTLDLSITFEFAQNSVLYSVQIANSKMYNNNIQESIRGTITINQGFLTTAMQQYRANTPLADAMYKQGQDQQRDSIIFGAATNLTNVKSPQDLLSQSIDFGVNMLSNAFARSQQDQARALQMQNIREKQGTIRDGSGLNILSNLGALKIAILECQYISNSKNICMDYYGVDCYIECDKLFTQPGHYSYIPAETTGLDDNQLQALGNQLNFRR